MDTGATDHITGELEMLTIHDKYNGKDQIHTASGAGMDISHIGHTNVHAPSRDLHLNNVLHVPKATKNFVSVYHLAADNHAYLQFHPNFFLIKDQATKSTLLRGRCHNGLHTLPLTPPSKQVFGVVKPSISRWHSRLGHPSLSRPDSQSGTGQPPR